MDSSIFLEYRVLATPTPHTHVVGWASSSVVENLSRVYVHRILFLSTTVS